MFVQAAHGPRFQLAHHQFHPRQHHWPRQYRDWCQEVRQEGHCMKYRDNLIEISEA
jgi:hypothetical protein